jgi:hypothetical protein
VRESVFAWANGDLTPEVRLGLDDDLARVTDEWTRRPGLPVDLAERYTRAAEGILTGQIATCSADCDRPFDPEAPMAEGRTSQPEVPADSAEPEAEASPA